MNKIQMNKMNESIEDILRDMRYGSIPKHRTDNELLCLYADRIETAHEREVVKLVVEISSMRSKLYGLAASIYSLTGRSDARVRGVLCGEVRNIAAQIENIADNGGRVCEQK